MQRGAGFVGRALNTLVTDGTVRCVGHSGRKQLERKLGESI